MPKSYPPHPPLSETLAHPHSPRGPGDIEREKTIVSDL
jgi:hypothetical protein